MLLLYGPKNAEAQGSLKRFPGLCTQRATFIRMNGAPSWNKLPSSLNKSKVWKVSHIYPSGRKDIKIIHKKQQMFQDSSSGV